MRKTHAPSLGGIKRSIGTVIKNSAKPFPEASRSTNQLLNLLSNPTSPELSSVTNTKSEQNLALNLDVEILAEIDNQCDYNIKSSSNKKFYNVVWSKQTTKKHKTWEGDGTVEVNDDGIAILRDENGVVLGRTSKLKNLEEGSRAFIGNKEIEIIDVITKEQFKKMCQNYSVKEINSDVPPNINVEKSNQKNINCYYQRPVKRLKTCTGDFKSPFACESKECLVMPKPDYSHQRKYNNDKLPLTDVKLDLFLSRVLRPHQQEGVKFLYSCVTGIRNMKYYGAILADEMGLGKTLQCISLIWILLKTGPYGGISLIQRVLIVTPSSLVTNWLKEFKRWLGFERLQPFIVNQKQKPSDYINLPASARPVMIISYEMLMRHHDPIKDIKFHLLICDEGHRLKNNQIRISMLLSQLEIKRKIILTGTPVQNNLQEFFALVDFVNPGIFGQYPEFKKQFEAPIIASNQPECTDQVKELGDLKAKELNHLTSSFILRRTQRIIDQYLPSKQECVVFCSSTQLQAELYKAAVSYWESSLSDVTLKVPHLSVITVLKKICNSPELIRTEQEDDYFDGDITDFGLFEKSLLQHLQPIFENFKSYDMVIDASGKMIVLELFLSELQKLNEKVVLISYFTQTLNLLTSLCNRKNYSVLRLDGDTPASARLDAVEKFNSPTSQHFIFLLSAKAGGLGLNLIGASRLVLFDLDWNPASDLQAMSRIWRDGQKKSVYIYRFLTTGSIEEKIYQRQISKTFLCNAVVDIQQGSNVRVSVEELKDLFAFKPECQCLTHELLMCDCEGDGLPEAAINDEDNGELIGRESQLSLENQRKEKNIYTISELNEWEHYANPVAEHVLEELCLKSAVDHISFLFRNKYSVSSEEN